MGDDVLTPKLDAKSKEIFQKSMALSYFKPEVHQDDRFYYVKIHPSEKEIAKEIRGRSWDGEISRWVYPKNAFTYQKLCEILKEISESFDISPPNECSASDKDNEHEPPSNCAHDAGTSRQEHEKKPEDNAKALESLGLALSAQSLCLEEIKEYVKSLNNTKSQINSSSGELRLSNPEDRSKLNYFVLQVLSYGCKKSESEQIDWILKDFALESIVQFVTQKHETIRDELRLNILLEEQNASFPRLVHTAKDQGAYINTREGSIDLYGALLMMNNIRNNLAHPDPSSTNSRIILMGLLYSLLLVEVWSHIAPQ